MGSILPILLSKDLKEGGMRRNIYMVDTIFYYADGKIGSIGQFMDYWGTRDLLKDGLTRGLEYFFNKIKPYDWYPVYWDISMQAWDKVDSEYIQPTLSVSIGCGTIAPGWEFDGRTLTLTPISDPIIGKGAGSLVVSIYWCFNEQKFKPSPNSKKNGEFIAKLLDNTRQA